MNETRINVADLLNREIGSKKSYQIRLSRLAEGCDLHLCKNTQINLTLTNLQNKILADMTMKTQIQSICSRCAKVLCLPTDISFSQSYAPSGLQGDDDFTISNRGEIDILSSISQELILSVPMKPLCQPRCEGIKMKSS